jgi:hypothetical protein
MSARIFSNEGEMDMKMRYVAAGLAVVTMLMGGTAAALARPHHGGRGGAPCDGASYGMPRGVAVTPEQEAAMEALFQKHIQAVEPLRQELYAKRLELDALGNNPNARPETITGLSREIAKLDGELRKANLDFRAELRNDPNIKLPPYGAGPWGDMRGHGPYGGGCR